MSTIVTAADAAQFLSVLPQMLGYSPVRSLVIVPLSGGRSLGALRYDLPATGAPPGPLASTVTGTACRLPDVDAVIGAVYTDTAVADALADDALARALTRCADASGLRIVDLLVVAADGWGSLRDPECPPGGRSLEEITTSPLGPIPRGDQGAGARLPAPGAGRRRAVRDALASLHAALAVVCGLPRLSAASERVDPAALQAACELDDLPRLYEQALTWDAESLTPMQAALLVWCLARPSVRDVALVQWAGDEIGGIRAFDAQRRWEDGEEYPADLAARMWGEGVAPDPARLQQALQLVRHVAAVASRRERPGALAMCAWLSWAVGLSTHADRYAEQAQRIDPEHGLSHIVRSFVAAGHLPDWAFRRRVTT